MITVTNTDLFIDHNLLLVKDDPKSNIVRVSAIPGKGEQQEDKALREIAEIVKRLKMRGIGFQTWNRYKMSGKQKILCADTVIFHKRYCQPTQSR